MKKILNYAFVALVLVTILFALTGCGTKETEKPVVETEK